MMTECIEISTIRRIGGTNYTNIYKGTFRTQQTVAVKTIAHILAVTHDDDNIMNRLDNPFVVKLYGIQDKWIIQQGMLRLFALELAVGSMEDLYLPDEDPKKYRGPVPEKAQGMLQISKGLQHIHSRGCFHGNIKPTKALLFVCNNQILPYTMFKVSDFGLTPHTRLDSWSSPETLNEESTVNPFKIDVFVAGILFFYFVTDGTSHPFGNEDVVIKSNILREYSVNMSLLSTTYFATDIITKMLAKDPVCRITMDDVIDELFEMFTFGGLIIPQQYIQELN